MLQHLGNVTQLPFTQHANLKTNRNKDTTEKNMHTQCLGHYKYQHYAVQP